jgi:hypothetical protein
MNLKPDKDVVFERLSGDILLLHARTNRFYELNQTGARVWELIASGASLPDILDQLRAEFNSEPETLATDVHRLLDELLREQLLHRSAPSVNALASTAAH